MNKYELTLVLDGKAGTAKKKKVVDSVEKILVQFKGKVLNTTEWGVKDLAYKIGKSLTGMYTHFEIELEPKGVKVLNEKLRTDADVIRFLVIKK